jgi:hypothetical protein
MYLVTKNNPFYPDVEYFDTIEEARTRRNEWIKEIGSARGEYQTKITISEEMETFIISTDY